jgi:urease accessory protein
MRVPLAEVGRRGRMELRFSFQNDRTVIKTAYCEVPFKITRLLDAGAGISSLIVMHTTAGLFGGDDLTCSIHVEKGARVRLTQQSATKIHPSEDRLAVQRTHVVVESGAELHLHLEPVIPFAGSRLRQETTFHVATGGTLSYWESFMTGRIGHGESWKFRELASETRVFRESRLVYLDRFLLLPEEQAPSSWTMANNEYTGLGLYSGPHAREAATRLHELVGDCGVDLIGEDLALTRVVSRAGPEFHRRREMLCATFSGGFSPP